MNGTAARRPFTRTVIVGSTNTISAISPQTKGPKTYTFVSWSDGGAQTHNIDRAGHRHHLHRQVPIVDGDR